MFQRLLSSRELELDGIPRRILTYFLDLVALCCAALMAFELRFDGAVPSHFQHPMCIAMFIWAPVQLAAFIAFRVSWDHWRHTSVYDAGRILLASFTGSVIGGVVVFRCLGSGNVPRSAYVLDFLLTFLLALSGRLTFRVMFSMGRLKGTPSELKRVLIYGAGTAAMSLIAEFRQNGNLKYDVRGLIDDDPRKANLNLHGKRVLGTGDTLGALVQKHGIKKVLIAIPSASGQQMLRILKLVTDAKVEYKTVPSLGELVQGADLGKQIREVAVEDLLGRKPVNLDWDRIRERTQGRVVMVTGAAGSIGSEICRQIASFSPLAIVGFDEAETPLFHIDKEMAKSFPYIPFYPEIGSIANRTSLKRVMRHYHPSILFHAAAYKHVPLMEKHVFAAVETNIFGTWNVARVAVEHGVDDFVMISTDKAVRPTSMMGATKRTAEVLIRALQTSTSTKFVSVRFGNVLGSNGSVVPTFKEQIAAGGPVTVTHPEMTRYFMTIPEAAQLALQAFSIGKGGEIFVLEMGQPVKIVDLARNLILLSGLQPERDIKIQFTGLRPGEKMYEELNLEDEHMIPTSHSKIRRYLCHQNFDAAQIRSYLQRLQAIVEEQDVAGLVLFLKELIPDYNPGAELLKAALSFKLYDVDSAKFPVHRAESENSLLAKLTGAALSN